VSYPILSTPVPTTLLPLARPPFSLPRIPVLGFDPHTTAPAPVPASRVGRGGLTGQLPRPPTAMPSSPKLHLHRGLRRPGTPPSRAPPPTSPPHLATGPRALPPTSRNRTAGSAAAVPAPHHHRIARGATWLSPGSSPSSGVQLHRAPSRAAPDVAPLASPEPGRSTRVAGPPLASPVLAEMRLDYAEIRRRRRGSGRRRLSLANMDSYAISSSLILVIHDNMINGTNHIV
jgi:hypothetical protein